MSTSIEVQGEVLRDTRQSLADGVGKNLQLNHQGAALVALPLALNGEIARQQNTYVAGTVTAVAPVAVIPTTASHLSLYAPSSGTKSLLIHRIASYVVVSAGAAIVVQLLVHMTTVSVTSITGTTATTPKGISGAGTATATIFSAVTTVANGTWHPLGPSVVCAGTANIALGTDTGDLGGLYIVEPGMHLDMAILCSAAATATCSIFVTWSEVVV